MKSKIVIVFFLALVAVGFIGYVGRTTISDLINSIHTASNDSRHDITQELLSNLSAADNSVRTYTITRSTNELITFSSMGHNIQNNLEWLKKSAEGEELAMLNTLEQLVNEKYRVIDELVRLKKNKAAFDVLDRMSSDMKKIVNTNNIVTEMDTGNIDKKGSLVGRIFKKNKSAEVLPKSMGLNEDNITNDVNVAINKIRQEDETIKSEELRLTLEDVKLSFRIREILVQIEQINDSQLTSKTELAQAATDKAIFIINTVGLSALAIISALILIILHDIDISRKNRIKLKEAKDQAEKLARTKEEFLANMSHEIRSPLNSIIGFSEQLKETTLNHAQFRFLKHINNSGQHLLQIVNDVLDYSKLEQGKMSIETIGFKPGKTLKTIIDSYKSQADEKGIVLQYELDTEIPEVIIGDPVRFKQIVINLVSNSLKFTERGHIKVTLNWKSHPILENQMCYELQVDDSGIGISKSKQEFIFQEFSQEDSSTTRKYGGTGLGLSIVSKIVHAMDGKISVESKLGSGTLFTVIIPSKEGSNRDIPKPHKVNVNSKALKGAKILVVDDQDYNLELTKILFEKWEVEGTYVDSGAKALQKFSSSKFDLILMDLQMPELSGFETTRKIRKMENGTIEHTPIVALSAASLPNQIEKAYDAGMDDYLAKPITEQALFLKLVNMFDMIAEDVSISYPEDEFDAVEVEHDFNELYQLSEGDPKFVSDMLKLFMTNFEKDFELLSNAIDEGKHSIAGDKAHKILSPARHLGFTKLSIMLRSIEQEVFDGCDLKKMRTLANNVENEYAHIKPTILKEIEKTKLPQL